MTKYASVRQAILDEIGAGLGVHDRLPTERELSDRLEVSRLTVRRAIQELEGEGVVYRIQGSGTYVAEPRIRKSTELTSFSEDMRARGLVPGARLVSADTVAASAEQGWRLAVSPGTPVHSISRIRLANAQPMCLEDVWIVAALAPQLLEADLEGSLYDTLSTRYRVVVDRAEQEVRATVLDAEQAELLEVPPLSPALQIERVTYDVKGRALEYARSRYRGDRYSVMTTLNRP